MQAGDREARVLADSVPGRPDLGDRHVAGLHVGLNLELRPQVLGHTLSTPEPDPMNVGLRDRHDDIIARAPTGRCPSVQCSVSTEHSAGAALSSSVGRPD